MTTVFDDKIKLYKLYVSISLLYLASKIENGDANVKSELKALDSWDKEINPNIYFLMNIFCTESGARFH